jgi:hypothetical protein
MEHIVQDAPVADQKEETGRIAAGSGQEKKLLSYSPAGIQWFE